MLNIKLKPKLVMLFYGHTLYNKIKKFKPELIVT